MKILNGFKMPKNLKLTKKWLYFVMFALFIWSYLIEPRWVAHREISLSHTGVASSSTHGLKVVLTSDWRFSKRAWWKVMTIARARKIVAEINASQPDVIIIAGDLIADRDASFSAATWSCISATKGETTIESPCFTSAGTW